MSAVFINNLQKYLVEQNSSSIFALINNEENTAAIQENPWEILPSVTAYINSRTERENLDFFECCTKFLDLLIAKTQPDDVLLVLIKDVETASDDVMFLTLLKPLQNSVLKLLQGKRINYLAWCCNSIQTYINELPTPENLNLEGGEKLLMDCDDIVIRISTIYHDIIPFYDPILQDIKKYNLVDCRVLLMKYLLQLLGKPIAYLDMDIEHKPKSKARITAENLMYKICALSSDVYEFLEPDFNKECDDIKVKNLAISIFFYMLLSEHIGIEKAPKVYKPVYVFQNCLRFVVELFNNDNQFIIEKGFKLSTALLNITSGTQLSYLLLDSQTHCKFCKSLSNIMIYSPIEVYRKTSLKIFHTYLHQFDTRGRYLLIYNITRTINYTALIAYIITLYKEMMVEQFDKCERVSEYFCGPKLVTLLNMFCKLPKGVETDLMKLADQIIASINLLRYLAIRDKENVTKIWEHFEVLKDRFLKPLRTCLMLSKAHYNLKIKEIMTENAHGDKFESNSKVSVTIAGENLPELSPNEKLKVLNSSITAFDVIESLLSRLNECIENKP